MRWVEKIHLPLNLTIAMSSCGLTLGTALLMPTRWVLNYPRAPLILGIEVLVATLSLLSVVGVARTKVWGRRLAVWCSWFWLIRAAGHWYFAIAGLGSKEADSFQQITRSIFPGNVIFALAVFGVVVWALTQPHCRYAFEQTGRGHRVFTDGISYLSVIWICFNPFFGRPSILWVMAAGFGLVLLGRTTTIFYAAVILGVLLAGGLGFLFSMHWFGALMFEAMGASSASAALMPSVISAILPLVLMVAYFRILWVSRDIYS